MPRFAQSRLIAAVSTVLSLACIAPLHAQEQARTGDGVTYISGGVGEDSRDRLNGMARDYNLRVMFTLNEGNFLSGVHVTIADSRGRKIVEDVSDGPFFMAKVAPGTYTVTATHEGKTQTRKMSVGSRGGQVAHLRWPSNPETDFPTPREQAGSGKRDLAG
jgi:hypothetical protein